MRVNDTVEAVYTSSKKQCCELKERKSIFSDLTCLSLLHIYTYLAHIFDVFCVYLQRRKLKIKINKNCSSSSARL